MQRDGFQGKERAQIHAVSYVEMAEQIEMSFGLVSILGWAE